MPRASGGMLFDTFICTCLLGSSQHALPQEYDASTVDELAVDLAEFGNLAARHNLVEIAEACRRESANAQGYHP